MRISDWSSDVCSSDLHAALTEPATADAGAVIGRQRNLETAVAVQQRRVVAIALERFGRDHEIRHLGAVLGGGEMLADRQTTGIEECRQLLERSEEHTSELQSLMRISYAVFCLKKKKKK